tara:strand:- start:1579 stop:2052 length:474 start_codon:yes stop_codon:yes gene_type:complete
MVYIYILLLEQKKYYIGKTYNPNVRINNHFNNIGAEWTRLYKPLARVKLIEDCDDEDEDKYTIQYMKKYGIENVRGGTFCRINLCKEEKYVLDRMIKSSNNECYNCGEISHFINQCPHKIYKNSHTMNKKKKINKEDNKYIKKQLSTFQLLKWVFFG